MGDPYGVGPEVAVKALRARGLPAATYSIVGSRKILDAVGRSNGRSRKAPRLKVIEPDGLSVPNDFRRPHADAAGGAFAVACIRKAVDLLQSGDADAVVTAPLCKESIHAAGYTWPGHTEMLAEMSQSPFHAMMFVGPRLKVSLVTIHQALRRVPWSLSTEKVRRTIELTHSALRDWFGIRRARIAVAGLNPHAGENGAFGSEDEEFIRPAVERAVQDGIRADGPLPADAMFHRLYQGEFHAAVCMYHDQALGPFKMIHFKDGVNLTLGLPFVRTSPDHGTAFDIAWKNKADPASMIAAIRLAVNLARRSGGGRKQS